MTSFRLRVLDEAPDTWDRSHSESYLPTAREMLAYERNLSRNDPGVQWWSAQALPIYWDTRELTIAFWELEVAIHEACAGGTGGSPRFVAPPPPAPAPRGSALSS